MQDIQSSSFDLDGLNMCISSLQLSGFPSAKIKVDELLLEWININDTGKIIDFLLEEASSRTSDGHSIPAPPDIQNSTPPPRSPSNNRSPKKRLQSEISNAPEKTKGEKLDLSIDKGSESEDSSSAQTTRRRSNIDTIPVFYVRGRGHRSRKPIVEDQLMLKLTEIESYFKAYPSGIPFANFVHITKGLCGLPSFFNLPLCRRITQLYPPAANPSEKSSGSRQNRQPAAAAGMGTGRITLKMFLQFWQAEMEPFDRYERFFRLIKQPTPGVDYIAKDDFVPFIQELLHFHPGLEFLESHDEFQRKYALTVIARIFFKVNLSRTGRLSLREVRGSNIAAEFMHVDEETDINRVVEYFSYEHFYVLYCRFFELDADKDSKLSRDDLLKYGEHALSEAIVDRVFQVGCRAFSDGKEGGYNAGGMTYSDFVYFMLAEEDKTSEASLSYWFACCDLDSNGVITPDELRYFYRSQLHRIASLGQETVSFADVMCQMIDMISPNDERAITLKDLLRPSKRAYSGVLFDVLFNLHKFMRFEARDPFQEKQRREDMFQCDWDRFAHIEYHRLAAEEEEGYDSSMDVDIGEEGKRHQADMSADSDWLIDDDDDDDDDLVLSRSMEKRGAKGSKGVGR
eukprot:CAMPEP_0185026688 /NCGR_PEP_ID=MMETSP1103-20130426/11010_1 /TAXON_ID=36769 /ORGANISM="Paraphysomonas bandaiensis, Strain Caron Lab Isolate" /LENGTH=626 /DNA_ID=CAMNT_0027560353 /DNA_START=56 /DNA_END=1936 /DNA_ORIENTATION=-